MKHIFILAMFLACSSGLRCQELFHCQSGKENLGAKGHAFDQIPAGKSVDLVNFEGSGTIRKIWLTLSNRSPEMLRSLSQEMYLSLIAPVHHEMIK